MNDNSANSTSISDSEFCAELRKVIKNFKFTYEHHDVLQRQILCSENQILHLQKALSDLQASLSQEREHCLKLSIENEILRNELTRLSQSRRTEPNVYQHGHLPFVSQGSVGPEEYVQWKHVEQQIKLAQNQAIIAIEESQVLREELESRDARKSAKISSLLDRLKSSQELLYETLEDCLELKKSLISETNESVTKSSNSLSHYSCSAIARSETGKAPKPQPRCFVKPNSLNGNDKHQQIFNKIEALQKQVEELKKVSVTVSDGDQNFFRELQNEQEMLKNSLKQLKNIQPLCQKLERKHNNDIEGLRSDMRGMKSQLKSLELILSRTVRQMTEDEKDMKYLEAVNLSSAQMKQISEELRRLKLKLAQLEHNLRST